jgi:hypothetical protein
MIGRPFGTRFISIRFPALKRRAIFTQSLRDIILDHATGKPGEVRVEGMNSARLD